MTEASKIAGGRPTEEPASALDAGEAPRGSQGQSGRARLARLAGYVVAAVLVGALASVAVSNWGVVRSFGWRVKPWLLAASFLGLAAARSLHAVGVQRVMRLFGKRAPLALCWRAYWLSQLAKYVPGGIWLFLARAYLYRKYGLARATGAVIIAVEQVAVIAGALVAFLLTLPWLRGSVGGAWVAGGALTLVVLLASLHPRVVSWLYNLVHRRFDGATAQVRVAYGGMLCLVALYTALWAAAGLSFCLMVAAVAELPAIPWVALVGMFAGACGLGFLVVVAPGGLGVREGGLAALLSLACPLPVAAALALAARLWWVVTDLGLSGLTLAAQALFPDPAFGPGRRAGVRRPTEEASR